VLFLRWTPAATYTHLSDCSVESATVAGEPVRALVFTREFAQNGDAAEKKYKDWPVTLTGKVQSVDAAKGQAVLAGYKERDTKTRPGASYTVTVSFGRDWNDVAAKLKPGDEVVVSGDLLTFSPREAEVYLADCWLIRK